MSLKSDGYRCRDATLGNYVCCGQQTNPEYVCWETETMNELLKHVNWETYNKGGFQQAVADLLLEYSEWLDMQGLIVGDGMTMQSIARKATGQDTRTHQELVNAFLAERDE